MTVVNDFRDKQTRKSYVREAGEEWGKSNDADKIFQGCLGGAVHLSPAPLFSQGLHFIFPRFSKYLIRTSK
jgi:hypothetical protein